MLTSTPGSVMPPQGVPSVVPGQINTFQPGSTVSLPPNSIVNVPVNGSLVPVRTVPLPNASIAQTQPLLGVQPPVARQSFTVPLPATSSVQTQSIPMAPMGYGTTSVQPPQTVPFSTQSVQAPMVQNEGNPTPTVKTLPPRIERNQLPPQYKTVTLPPKVVTSRLPPIGPAPTPQLSNLASQTMVAPATQSITPGIPQPIQASMPFPGQTTQTLLGQTVQSTLPYPGQTQTTVLPSPVQSVPVPQPGQLASTLAGTTSVNPIATNFGTTSVPTPIVGSQFPSTL